METRSGRPRWCWSSAIDIDVDLSIGTLTLYDGKGAAQPWRHVLPLVKAAGATLKRRLMLSFHENIC